MKTRIPISTRLLVLSLGAAALSSGPAAASRWLARSAKPAKTEKADDPVAIQFRVGKDLEGREPKVMCAPRVHTAIGVAAELKTRFGEGRESQEWNFKVTPMGRVPGGVFCLVELDLGGQIAHRYVTLKNQMQKIQLTTLRGEVLEVGLEKLDPGMIAPVALGP